MFGLDKYTDSVLLAYGVSILLLAILLVQTLAKYKKIKLLLDEAEKK